MTILNDTLNAMFRAGAKRITFLVDDHMQAVVVVDQQLKTPTGGIAVTHNSSGADHEIACREVQKQLDKCGELQSKIVKLGQN